MQGKVGAIAVSALKALTSGADRALSVKNEGNLLGSAHGSRLLPHSEGFKTVLGICSVPIGAEPNLQSLLPNMYFLKSGQCLKIFPFEAVCAPLSGGVNGSPSCFPNSAKIFMNIQPGRITLFLGDKGRLLRCCNGAEIE